MSPIRPARTTVPAHRRGRPPSEEPTAPLSVRLPVSILAVVQTSAEARGESVSCWLRRTILEGLAAEGAIRRSPGGIDCDVAPSRLASRVFRSS